MNTNPKKEETPLEPTSPRDSNKLSEPNLPAKRVKLSPFMHESDVPGVRKREERIAKNLLALRKFTREKILAIGGDLAWIRARIAHGQWGPYIDRTFSATYQLSIRTATTWMQAYEGRNTELALNDWDEYMRGLYGHKPKKLKAPSSEEERDPDDEQSGGEGLSFGEEHHKKGTLSTVGMAIVMTIMKTLRGDYLDRGEYTREMKLEVVRELQKQLAKEEQSLLGLGPEQSTNEEEE